MPTDHVKNRTFKEMLGSTVRFKIPFFQRGYAWERKQWDIRRVARTQSLERIGGAQHVGLRVGLLTLPFPYWFRLGRSRSPRLHNRSTLNFDCSMENT
jgi:hypothetical protein